MSATKAGAAICVWTLLMLADAAVSAQSADDIGTITSLRGNVYRADSGSQATVFWAGADGIVVLDPLNRDFARFLAAQFAQRFPGRTVKYVVYTGADFDRIGGASLFDATAEVVAHERFNERSNAMRPYLPPRFASLDANRNNVFDPDEIGALIKEPTLARIARRDRGVTAESLWSEVLSAESQFGTRRTLSLGDGRIELIYPGPAAGVGNLVVYFPDERILFAAKHPPLAAPFSDRTVKAAEVVRWTDAVAETGFETLLDSRGDTAARADVDATNHYARAVVTGLKHGQARGLSAAELQSGPSIDRFEGTPFARVRDGDIAALYQRARVLALDAFASGLVVHADNITFLCGLSPFCPRSSANGPGVLGGAGFTINRVRGTVEFSTAPGLVFEDVDNLHTRERQVTFLGGFRTHLSRRVDMTPMGGITLAKTHFTSYISEPFSRTLTGNSVGFALTFGADAVIPVSSRVELVIPLRVTPSHDVNGAHDNLGVKAGLGVSLTYRRYSM